MPIVDVKVEDVGTERDELWQDAVREPHCMFILISIWITEDSCWIGGRDEMGG